MDFLRKHPVASLLAVVIHAVLIYFLVYGFMHKTVQMNDVLAEISEDDMVQAQVYDPQMSQALTQKPAEVEDQPVTPPPPAPPEPITPPPDAAQQAAQLAEQQKQEAQKKQAEADAKKKADEQKRAEY
ncbi:MAG: hypothetical protein K0U21_05640, partial [Proteobacteria bacterium]|nr:hypothetical protein [Pseudomonadota bacterium]